MGGIFLITLFAIIFLGGCINQPEEETYPEVKGMEALIVLMPNGFRDEEFRVPKEKLENAGVEVTVAGLEPGECKGMLGMRHTPETVIDDINVDDFDAIIVPGGAGSPKHLWDNSRVQQLVRDAYEKGKIVAGICLTTAMFANAGILEGKDVTVSPSDDAIRVLKEKGANYKQEDVVVDGNIITAVGPKATDRFADRILEKLSSRG